MSEGAHFLFSFPVHILNFFSLHLTSIHHCITTRYALCLSYYAARLSSVCHLLSVFTTFHEFSRPSYWHTSLHLWSVGYGSSKEMADLSFIVMSDLPSLLLPVSLILFTYRPKSYLPTLPIYTVTNRLHKYTHAFRSSSLSEIKIEWRSPRR